MQKKKPNLGLLYGLLGLFLIGLQPVIIIARPKSLDTYIFAAMATLFATFFFLPLVFIERKRLKTKIKEEPSNSILYTNKLTNWKNHYKFLFYLGLVFGLGRVFFYFALDLVGASIGSVLSKAGIVMALIFGYYILKEKITLIQIIISFVLLTGLIIVIINGSFVNFVLNFGVIIILVVGLFWTHAHCLTKPLIEKGDATPIFMVFIRSFLATLILFPTYFIFFPLQNVMLFTNIINIIFFVAIGFVHGFGLFCWYKTISYMRFSRATILYAPTPIISSILAYFFLDEELTIFTLIGIAIVIFSIIVIMREKETEQIE